MLNRHRIGCLRLRPLDMELCGKWWGIDCIMLGAIAYVDRGYFLRVRRDNKSREQDSR
jgi:hypothetical protein